MVILNKFLALASISLLSTVALAAPSAEIPEKPPEEESTDVLSAEIEAQLCKSTHEYIKTLKFLRNTREFTFPEKSSRLIAHQVSKGCTGAAERFAEILILLKKVGLSEKKSLEVALDFAAYPPQVQKNFLEIFTKSFLLEFFDYEFHNAVKTAFELSRDYKGNPANARQDFIELVKFCKSTKELDLPMSFCSEYTVRIAKLSQYYPNGVRTHFLKLFQELREKKELSLDVKTALEVAYVVLKAGPKGPENFFEAYKFGTERDGLNIERKKALEFAMVLATRSHLGEKPPVIPSDKTTQNEELKLE